MRRASALATLTVGGALMTAGCAETQLGAQVLKDVSRTDAPATPASRTELAPESFDATGLTIWDGARTLQGVWVAHPLAQRAQRVRVVNIENGLEVEGAMFRRDPAISGPSILVSSDTAFSLGLQPGRPTELRITALKEGVYASETATAAAEGEPVADGEIETAALDPIAPVEEDAAPLDAAREEEAAEPPAAAPAPEPVDEEALAPEDAAQEEAAQEDAPIPTPAPIEEAPAAAEAAPAEPPADETPPPVEIAEDEADPAPEFAAVEEAAPAAPAPEPRPEPPSAQGVNTANLSEPDTPEPAAPPASNAVSGDLPRGVFVQAGAFRVQSNAEALVAKLRADGQPAQYVQRGSGDAPLNIVMVGPLDGDDAVEAAISAAESAGAGGARKVVR